MEQSELRFDITIQCGADYSIDFVYTDDDEVPVDVTGWTVEAQLREYPEHCEAVAFTCSADDNGFHLSLDSVTTAVLGYSQGSYDVFITDPDDGYRTPLISGKANIKPSSTR